jgi:transcriptional regulator with XRE-family HTH domain
MTTLSERLKEIIRERKLSQESLAEKAGVSQTTIHKLLSGKALESRKISKIAEVLGVNTDWLAIGKGDKFYENYQGNNADNNLKIINWCPVIEESKWKELPQYTKAFFENLLNKSSSGKLTHDHIEVLQNMVNVLSK